MDYDQYEGKDGDGFWVLGVICRFQKCRQWLICDTSRLCPAPLLHTPLAAAFSFGPLSKFAGEAA